MLLDPRTLEPTERLSGVGGIVSVAQGPAWIAAGCDNGSIHVFDTRGRPRAKLTHPGGEVTAMSARPTRRLLVSIGRDGRGAIWDTRDWSRKAEFAGRVPDRHGYDQFLDVALCSDGKWAFTVSWNGRLSVWSTASGALADEIEVHGSPSCVAWLDGNVYVGCLDSTVCVYRHQPGR